MTTYTVVYMYDADGRIDSVITQNGSGSDYKSVDYVYSDVTGQKTATRVLNSSGGQPFTLTDETDYTYDDLGRLETVTPTQRNGNTVSDEQASYVYTVLGSRESLEYGNGNVAAYQYNALNRLTNLTNWETDAKTTGLSTFGYTLYADGMRERVTETVKVGATPTNETRTVEYEYDNLNRLTDETATAQSPATGSYDIDYTYDLVGNRKQRLVTIGGNVLTTNYVYDPNTDRLETETHSGPTTCMVVGNERYYAYIAPGGGFYYLDDNGKRMSGFKTFMSGLPLRLNQWLFRVLMLLIPVALLAPVVAQRQNFCSRRRFLGVLCHRGVCVLLAYIFLISPELFHQLARADIAYSDLCTVDWGSGNRTISYLYDDNGSVIEKTTEGTSPQETLEVVTYDYNFQNRLETVTTTPYSGGSPLTPEVTTYTYNPQGIRISKDVDGTATDYLIDSYNHTGYAQVLQETTDTDVRNYVIGDDMLAQSLNSNPAKYLLYDGHGSTRQLAASDGSTINDSYSYDAYGVMLGGNPTASAPAATNLLYAGEQYDSQLDQYYLRARYYNQNNGTFNRVDPYAGNMQDPQSLHKYAYVHNNPVNGIDPTGKMFTVMGMIKVVGIVAILGTLTYLTFANRSGEINTVEIYLTSGSNSIRKGILEKKAEFESHLGTIVKTKIISGAASGATYGYDGNSKTYRIKISWNKTQTALGYTHHENISFNYAAFDGSISNRESSDGIKFSDEQKAFLASNILLHETVHSIYDHNSSWYSGFTQHESTGLMVGFRWLDWFFPTFYDANPDSDKKMLPFSSTTQNRLNAAIRK